MNESDTHMMDFRLRHPIEFGRLPGLKAYDSWDSQQECCDFRVHGHRENRMVGDREGIRSIIMSGAYEDDEDQGNVVYYTGNGGQDRTGRFQTTDQTFNEYLNEGLRKTYETGNPVRLIRCARLNSVYAPVVGFRYDGLYIVEEAGYATGKSGFRICKFKLRLIPDSRQGPIPQRTLVPR